jgi:hypothetical protein
VYGVQHTANTAMFTGQREVFASANRAQKALLDAADGGGVALAPEMAAVESVIDMTQSVAGYTP